MKKRLSSNNVKILDLVLFGVINELRIFSVISADQSIILGTVVILINIVIFISYKVRKREINRT